MPHSSYLEEGNNPIVHISKVQTVRLGNCMLKGTSWSTGQNKENPHVLPILLCHKTAQKSSLIIPLFKVKLFSFRYRIVGFLFAKACRVGMLLVSGTTCMFKCSLGPSFRMDQGFGVESKPVAISGNTSSSPKLKEVHVWVVWKGLRTEVCV